MKYILLFLLFGTASITSRAQADNQEEFKKEIQLIQKEVTNIKNINSGLNKSLSNLTSDLIVQKDSIISLNTTFINTTAELKTNINQLQNRMLELDKKSNTKITALDASISKSTLYWIIAFLITALISSLIYFLLQRRIRSESFEVSEKIANTKRALEEEGVRLDNKLADILVTQLKLLQEDKVITKGIETTSGNKSEEADHSLALKVADEIIRIQKNISNMDPDTKGLKQLSASVRRIQDNFEANGYDLIDMLNKPYDPGMKVTANFRPDEKLKEGEQIITRIIKPQVNYKGVMIQAAQIEVSQGE